MAQPNGGRSGGECRRVNTRRCETGVTRAARIGLSKADFGNRRRNTREGGTRIASHDANHDPRWVANRRFGPVA
jgi:hypothetical protein